ncbi:hypothetical protein HCH_00633 [Hahella chejuensis KCTC 2396]|uniref:Uncharacterized protein n=1 Tax=Hahella chejuensis (strain KCTC 2396) TaxID=349521 RepID=Q2SP90_HAHCH|nr:hypothetical protein HCH_00633 [Hahella chejuensis KCTC 2396]
MIACGAVVHAGFDDASAFFEAWFGRVGGTCDAQSKYGCDSGGCGSIFSFHLLYPLTDWV